MVVLARSRGSAEFDFNNIYVNAGYFQTDGFQPELNMDGGVNEHPQNADNTYVFMKFKNESLTLTGSYSSYNYPDKYRSAKKEYYLSRKPIYGSARYNLDFEENGNLNLFAYYNNYSFYKDKKKFQDMAREIIKEDGREYMNTAIMGSDIEYSYQLKTHSLIAGLSIQRDMATKIINDISYPVNSDKDNVTNPDITRDDIGFFVQDVWEINQNILFTAGLRFDALSDFDNQFNYRIGVTGQSNSNIYGKLLYGTSYRVPSYREYIDIQSYNEDLQPEHLNTFEAQAGYLFNKGDVNLTLFHNSYTNFIQEILVDSIKNTNATMREVDDEMAFNFDDRSITGIEFNLIYYPTQQIFMNVGASYLITATEQMGNIEKDIFPPHQDPGSADIVFLSDYTLNFLMSYKLNKNCLFGLNGCYFGDRKTPDGYQDDVPDQNKNTDNAKGFFKLNMFAKANLGDNFVCKINANNVLNAKIYSPPYGMPDGYDYEWPGTTFRLYIGYKL